MTRTLQHGVVLDAGAFIALQRGKRVMVELTRLFKTQHTPLITSAGVVAQVWRSYSRRQVPMIFLLRSTDIVSLDYGTARLLGNMLGTSGGSDVVDAHIVLLARRQGWPVLSSDRKDLLRIDPGLHVEQI